MLTSFDVHDGQVLDYQKLLRMSGYLTAADFKEVISDYCEVLTARLARLADSDLSLKEVKSICHDVVNFAGTLGLCELKDATQHLADRMRDADCIDELAVERVRISGDRALSAIKIYMQNASQISLG